MKSTATYYESRKMLLIRVGSWTITGRIPTRNHARMYTQRFGLLIAGKWQQDRPGVWQCNLKVKR